MKEGNISAEIQELFFLEECYLEKWLMVQRCYNIGFVYTAKKLEGFYNEELYLFFNHSMSLLN